MSRIVRGFNVVEMTHAGMAYSLVSETMLEGAASARPIGS